MGCKDEVEKHLGRDAPYWILAFHFLGYASLLIAQAILPYILALLPLWAINEGHLGKLCSLLNIGHQTEIEYLANIGWHLIFAAIIYCGAFLSIGLNKNQKPEWFKHCEAAIQGGLFFGIAFTAVVLVVLYETKKAEGRSDYYSIINLLWDNFLVGLAIAVVLSLLALLNMKKNKTQKYWLSTITGGCLLGVFMGGSLLSPLFYNLDRKIHYTEEGYVSHGATRLCSSYYFDGPFPWNLKGDCWAARFLEPGKESLTHEESEYLQARRGSIGNLRSPMFALVLQAKEAEDRKETALSILEDTFDRVDALTRVKYNLPEKYDIMDTMLFVKDSWNQSEDSGGPSTSYVVYEKANAYLNHDAEAFWDLAKIHFERAAQEEKLPYDIFIFPGTWLEEFAVLEGMQPTDAQLNELTALRAELAKDDDSPNSLESLDHLLAMIQNGAGLDSCAQSAESIKANLSWDSMMRLEDKIAEHGLNVKELGENKET